MTARKLKQPRMFKTNELKSQLGEKIALTNFIYTAAILNIINIAIVFFMQKRLPPEVPLFYGYVESGQQLTTPMGLLIPGVFAMILILGNALVSLLIKNDYLKKVLSTTSFTISLLSLITIIKIIFLVGL